MHNGWDARQCCPDQPPSRDQLFVERIELIALRAHRLQPVPLRDSGFDERSRRVGVVFEELGRVHAVVAQVEASIQTERLRVPGLDDGVGKPAFDCEAIEQTPLDDRLHRGERHLVQLLGRLLDHVDFERGEAVARRLVPVRAVEAVKVKADRLELGLPVPPRRDALALHHPPELCAEADEPKPPRLTVVLETALLPERGAMVLPVLLPECP